MHGILFVGYEHSDTVQTLAIIIIRNRTFGDDHVRSRACPASPQSIKSDASSASGSFGSPPLKSQMRNSHRFFGSKLFCTSGTR